MKTLLASATIFLLTGCSQTTTYKAPSLGWSKLIEAKTISLAATDCKNHSGYYESTQNSLWGGWNNNTRWYDSVELICLDGYLITYSIQQINDHYSPIVADILSKEYK